MFFLQMDPDADPDPSIFIIYRTFYIIFQR
jgi:hypothetical protein